MPSGNRSKRIDSESADNTESIHAKLDIIINRLDSFDTRIKDLEVEQREFAKSLNYIHSEIDILKSDIEKCKPNNALNDAVETLEYQARQKQIIVTQIPYREKENLLEAVQKIADKIGSNIDVYGNIDQFSEYGNQIELLSSFYKATKEINCMQV